MTVRPIAMDGSPEYIGTPAAVASVITFSDVSLLESSGGEADWPKHGYALIKDIEGFAGVKLGPGTLYGALAKLERAGLVEALPAEDRRRPYRITATGREFLNERLTESARIAEVGLRRIAAASS